jgi:hypothetical protein
MLIGEEPQLQPMPLALDWAKAHPEWQNKRFESALLFGAFFDIVKAQADLWRGAAADPN